MYPVFRVTLRCLSRGAASWARPAVGWNPSHVRRARAATLAPEGVTILWRSRHDVSRFPGMVDAQDVGAPDRVPMGNETAGRAAIDAPLWFVPVQTARAGLTRIGFVDQLDTHADRLRLVGNVLAEPAMRPYADLLLAYRIEPFAIRHVAHVPDHHKARL